MKIVSVLNQEHVLRGCAAPRICCHRHMSEVRDQFHAPAPLPPKLQVWRQPEPIRMFPRR